MFIFCCNRFLRKFTRPLEQKCGAGLEEYYDTLSRAERVINEELPQRMFAGKTSWEVFQEGEDYSEQEKHTLQEQLTRKQDSLGGLFFCQKKDLA